MDIGIIGAGNIGSALTRRFTQLGHTVTVANSRGPETLTDLAQETGATPGTQYDAARGHDVVVVTIPQMKVLDLPKDLFDGVGSEVVVIDTGNYYPQQRDGRIAEIEDGTTESRWVSRQLGRPVVKAFNNIYSGYLQDKGVPEGDPARFALPVAGDDPIAKQVVLDLVEQLGFDAVDAGTLDESWRQQPGSAVYGTDLPRAELEKALAAETPERPAEFTAA